MGLYAQPRAQGLGSRDQRKILPPERFRKDKDGKFSIRLKDDIDMYVDMAKPG